MSLWIAKIGRKQSRTILSIDDIMCQKTDKYHDYYDSWGKRARIRTLKDIKMFLGLKSMNCPSFCDK